MDTSAAAQKTATQVPSEIDRLDMIRFPLILMVVFFHNAGGHFIAQLQDSPVMATVVYCFMQGVGTFRVPTFFLIAGYLYFRNVNPTPTWFRSKVKVRAFSLLLPMLLWTTLWLVLIGLLQQIPYFGEWLNTKILHTGAVRNFSFTQFIQSYFGAPSEIFVYPLWYLRDLFILVLLTPAIYLAIRYTRGWVGLLLLGVWTADAQNGLVAVDALFFFFIGCQFALSKRPVFPSRQMGWATTILWLALQIYDPAGTHLLATKLKTLAGIGMVLHFFNWLTQQRGAQRPLTWLARFAFFLFIFHEPLLSFTRTIYLRVVHPVEPAAWLTAYFAVVVLVVSISMLVLKLGELTVPRFLYVMTGGRAGKAAAPRQNAAAEP